MCTTRCTPACSAVSKNRCAPRGVHLDDVAGRAQRPVKVSAAKLTARWSPGTGASRSAGGGRRERPPHFGLLAANTGFAGYHVEVVLQPQPGFPSSSFFTWARSTGDSSASRSEFATSTLQEFGEAVRHRNIVDGRNALDAEAWRAAGWTFRALGRPRA